MRYGTQQRLFIRDAWHMRTLVGGVAEGAVDAAAVAALHADDVCTVCVDIDWRLSESTLQCLSATESEVVWGRWTDGFIYSTLMLCVKWIVFLGSWRDLVSKLQQPVGLSEQHVCAYRHVENRRTSRRRRRHPPCLCRIC